MGTSPPDLPGAAPSGQWTDRPYAVAPRTVLARPERRTVHTLLFVLTLASTTLVGGEHYKSFVTGFATSPPDMSWTTLLTHGLWYSATLLSILGCHELGHYYACRYYGVDASPPYFLPMPFLLTGTLGAFIRIREPIPTKRALFDIGVAGPIAGFVVAVPALLLGLHLSTVVRLPSPSPDDLLELGEPLLFRAVSWLSFGSIPDGYTVNLHPMAFAAWFGLLATAINLVPIGQFDGGHIAYAVLGRRSSTVTLLMIPCLLALTLVSTSWAAWTVLTIAMLAIFGYRHPPTVDEDVPLDRPRRRVAVAAAAMFVVCFTPAPISPAALIGQPPALDDVERVDVDAHSPTNLPQVL